MIRATLTALLTASLAIVGCSADDGTAPTAGGPTNTADRQVDVVDFAFEPESVEVSVGTTVEWVFDEDESSRHTVDLDDGEASGDLDPGDTYTRTFQEPGEYAYVCFYHPRMTGTVTVID